MTQATLPQTNGSSIHPPQAWLKQSVQQFFNAVNWENHSLEIQTLRLAAQSESQPCSLLLTVNQFFSTINWEGDAATPPKPTPSPATSADSIFTLDDFSDLF
jgi:hypothetical protein